jgi:hypothetical protein
MHRLLVAACVVPTSPILVTLMKETLGSFETSVLETRGVNIPEDTILQYLHVFDLSSILVMGNQVCYNTKQWANF